MRIGISGHRDLTPETTAAVRAELGRLLGGKKNDPQKASCLATSATQMSHRSVVATGGRLVVIVPAEKYRDGLGAESLPEYDALMAAAAEVVRLPFVESTSESHMAASVAMLDRIDELVAVWDGKPSRGYGGTADVVDEAERRGLRVQVVWPAGATRSN